MGAAQALNAGIEHPAKTWAASGLMSLTGCSDGAALMCPVPLASCADSVLASLAEAAHTDFGELLGSQLLTMRAAITGHTRQGRTSPGGSCRLLDTADGLMALNLARDSDWDLLPAWLESDIKPDWDAVAEAVRSRAADALVDRARELGLAATRSQIPAFGPWMQVVVRGTPVPTPRRAPRVLDLSSLWAGPLCGQLLHRCGAQVTKLESRARPDGARAGPRVFFDWLNAGKAQRSLDFSTAGGREQLRQAIAQSDIVIEASRPRALRQLGIDAEQIVREQPGLTWICLTGYGRGQPQENWIAYGDDAGVAAGLSELMRQATGRACMVGDAIADPLTGLHAALAAWTSWRNGGGELLSLSLQQVVRHCMGADLPQGEALRARQADWTAQAGPALRPALNPARTGNLPVA